MVTRIHIKKIICVISLHFCLEDIVIICPAFLFITHCSLYDYYYNNYYNMLVVTELIIVLDFSDNNNNVLVCGPIRIIILQWN